MNCPLCDQELIDFKEDWSADWDCLDNRVYHCKPCGAHFTQKVVYKQVFTNEKQTDWRWEDSGKEELTYYKQTIKDYEIECFVWSKGPFIVRQWDNEHKFIWGVLKFPFIPPNLKSHNLVDRIRTWVLFS